MDNRADSRPPRCAQCHWIRRSSWSASGGKPTRLGAIREAGRYALNFLFSGDAASADRFAGSKGTKFEGVEWDAAPGGSPLLSGVMAWVECDVERDVGAGDHTIFIGRVTAADIASASDAPLVHFGGRYHTVAALDE